MQDRLVLGIGGGMSLGGRSSAKVFPNGYLRATKGHGASTLCGEKRASKSLESHGKHLITQGYSRVAMMGWGGNHVFITEVTQVIKGLTDTSPPLLSHAAL